LETGQSIIARLTPRQSLVPEAVAEDPPKS
jgi:hypothetical protein